MFVVAATALALPWTKAIVAAHYDRNHELRELIGVPLRWHTVVSLWCSAAVPSLIVGSLAVLIFGSRPPRPPLYRLFRRPGMVAAGAAILALIVQLSLQGAAHAWKVAEGSAWMRFQPPRGGFLARLEILAFHGGFFVMAAWMPLVAGRRWRPSHTWTDRAGRVLGLAWIALSIVQWFVRILGGL